MLGWGEVKNAYRLLINVHLIILSLRLKVWWTIKNRNLLRNVWKDSFLNPLNLVKSISLNLSKTIIKGLCQPWNVFLSVSVRDSLAEYLFSFCYFLPWFIICPWKLSWLRVLDGSTQCGEQAMNINTIRQTIIVLYKSSQVAPVLLGLLL